MADLANRPLSPITALGASLPRSQIHGALHLVENAGLALASVALRHGAAQPVPFGLALPEAGAWATSGAYAALWTGPGQWLIEGEGLAETDFAAAVLAACPGCSVTEQTDGFVAFEVISDAGEAPILALMAKLVNIAPDRLRANMGTRTGLEHMSVFVIRRAPERLAVVGLRSAAATIWHALDTAAARLAP